MKKHLISIVLIIIFVMNVKAQNIKTSGYMQISGKSDGFFGYNDEFRKVNNDEYELILLPKTHGLDYNYPADNVPIGQSLMLLSAFGVLYAIKRKR